MMERMMPLRYWVTQIPMTNCPCTIGRPRIIPVLGSIVTTGSPPIGFSTVYGAIIRTILKGGGQSFTSGVNPPQPRLPSNPPEVAGAQKL